MQVIQVKQGNSPILLCQPHTGTDVPDAIFQQFNDNGKRLSDTDWHIDWLYDGLLDDATIIKSNIHRYVIDANRNPSGESLYPGQNTTTLCPLTDFDGQSIYKNNCQPSQEDIQNRIANFHAPYHLEIEKQIKRLKQFHKEIILFDCHSIRSTIPFLFSGLLPILNIGTYNSQSCKKQIESIAFDICNRDNNYSCVLNGRFKGGWTTRHYGAPQTSVNAIQLEIAQRAYMQESPPWNYQKQKATTLRVLLAKLLIALNDHCLNDL